MSIVWQYCSSCPDKKFDINATETYQSHINSLGHKLAVEARLAVEGIQIQDASNTQPQELNGQDSETSSTATAVNVSQNATTVPQVSDQVDGVT